MKRFDASDVVMTLMGIVCGGVLLLLLGFIGFLIYDSATVTEVETYTVGCEVSQMAYAEETTGRSSSKPVYKMGVRNDDFATTFNITDGQFAKYVIGDIVEVKVTIWEHYDGTLTESYELIG